jgi:hypothetical protein
VELKKERKERKSEVTVRPEIMTLVGRVVYYESMKRKLMSSLPIGGSSVDQFATEESPYKTGRS